MKYGHVFHLQRNLTPSPRSRSRLHRRAKAHGRLVAVHHRWQIQRAKAPPQAIRPWPCHLPHRGIWPQAVWQHARGPITPGYRGDCNKSILPIDSLKYHSGPPCHTLQHPAGGPPCGRLPPQGERPAAVFVPYAWAGLMHDSDQKWPKSSTHRLWTPFAVRL
jgi:hypothetical protein